MDKLSVSLAIIGDNIKYPINPHKLLKWKSSLFQVKDIDPFQLPSDMAPLDGYSSEDIARIINNNYKNAPLVLSIADIPFKPLNSSLTDGKKRRPYVQKVADNHLCFTFFDLGEFLKAKNIPYETYIQKMIYSAALGFMTHGKILDDIELLGHRDIRGCIFDIMSAYPEVEYSCKSPGLCDSCCTKYKNGIPKNVIDDIRKELKEIKRPLFFRIRDWIMRHPIRFILLSIFSAICTNIIASFFYDLLRTNLNK